MEEAKSARNQVRLTVPIRIRGMSSRNKYFDEESVTSFVGDQAAVIRLRNLVELETELHVANLKNHVGGTFRVLWVNTHEVNGLHDVGVELIDPEGDLWETASSGAQPEGAPPVPEGWLECQRCHQKVFTPVPEVQVEYLQEGLLLARHCETCKATAAWASTVPSQPEPVAGENGAPPAEALPPEAESREDLRLKGRAPLEMLIKVIRHKYGTTLEEVCKTMNISRNGVYFLTVKNYEVGEQVQVILPYKEDDVSIPVPAFVVRQDQPKGTFERGVALQLAPPAK